MGSSAIIGHEAVLRELRALALGPEPAHALMVTGPENVGRMLIAREYAALLNCEARGDAPHAGGMLLETPPADPASLPCGVCRPCRLIAEGSHPDVVLLAPGDALCKPRNGDSSHEKHPNSRDIRICQVRGMIDVVSRYPYEARFRVIIVAPADRLGEEAAHTMLKTLEEPPGHTAIILVTAAPEAVLETIRSRCRRLDLRTVARAEIEEGLLARGVANDVAAAAAAASRGRPGKAITFSAQPDLIGDRERLLTRFARIASERTAERLRYAGELHDRWGRDRAQVHAELDLWEAFWEGQLRLAADADHTSVAAALAALRAITATREALLANVQPRPALDLMLLSFPRITLAGAPEDAATSHA